MSALVRTRVGPYRTEEAVQLDRLTPGTLDAHLLDPTTAVAALPKRVATAEEIDLLRAGRAIPVGNFVAVEEGKSVAVVDVKGGLLSLVRLDLEHNWLLPYCVFIEQTSA